MPVEENQVEQRPEIQRIQVEVQPQQQQEEEANRPADQIAVQRNRRKIPLSEQVVPPLYLPTEIKPFFFFLFLFSSIVILKGLLGLLVSKLLAL